jgi:hypothetical protein
MQSPRFATPLYLAPLTALLIGLLAAAPADASWSGYPPPDHPPPLVPKAPPRSSRSRQPHHGSPGGTPHTSSTPEPASMTTGLLGTGLACVYTWWRKRRAGRQPTVS